MKNPKFKEIKPNYRKLAFEIQLSQQGKVKDYLLPFSIFEKAHISPTNRVDSLLIDPETGRNGVFFTLANGHQESFPADLVLYYCEPNYAWSPLAQLKNALKLKVKEANLSVRTMADALKTSPAQVMRLFEEESASKQLHQLLKIAELAGYEVKLHLKKKSVA